MAITAELAITREVAQDKFAVTFFEDDPVLYAGYSQRKLPAVVSPRLYLFGIAPEPVEVMLTDDGAGRYEGTLTGPVRVPDGSIFAAATVCGPEGSLASQEASIVMHFPAKVAKLK